MGRTFLDDFDVGKKKRRKNREAVHIAEQSSQEDSQEDAEGYWNSDVEQQETVSQNDSLDMDESSSSADCLSQLGTKVRNASDKELQLVLAACIGRFSQKDLDRVLTTYDDPCFIRNVKSLWNCQKSSYSVHYFCNSCGKACMKEELCCGPVAKFVRVGLYVQLLELLEHHWNAILDLRKKLKKDEAKQHNLSSQFFCPLWQSEPEGTLFLSSVLSVDGVSISGNTRKIWPVSLVLLDLPTADMQASTNVLLEGIVECTVNPSTTLWNALYPMIKNDCHNIKGSVRNMPFTMFCTTVSADQPAKRSFLGLRSHQSSKSCAYCVSDGTFFKLGGDSREQLGRERTLKDSLEGVNGFNDVASHFLQLFLPYETPVDVLHNFAEGIFDRIHKELFPKRGFMSKSNLFYVNDRDGLLEELAKVVVPSHFQNIIKRRNATDKLNYFRLMLCSHAIVSDLLAPEARIVIIGLALLVNRMYTGVVVDQRFDYELCSLIEGVLHEASEQYFSCKLHEILFHLPRMNELFKNCAPLSTFSFESAYQYILVGYSSKLTNNFCEIVTSRFLVHNSLRRELSRRMKATPSERLKSFACLTPGLQYTDIMMNSPISYLHADDMNPSIPSSSVFFSQLVLPIGILKSEYFDKETTDDMFFAELQGKLQCLRFIAAVNIGKETKVIGEPIQAIEHPFSSLSSSVDLLTGNSHIHAAKLVEVLKSYGGIVCGKLSSDRVLERERERERHRSSIKANESEFVGSHSQSCEVSNNNKWNPISFGRKYMYDSNEGVPLSKAAIEEGIMKLTKNKRPFDSSEFLKIASEFHGNSPLLESLSIGMAVMTEAFNSGFRNSSQSGNTSNLKPFIISNIGFNLTQAKKNESLIVLPSGCQFFMSQALTNYQASNYTSSEYKTHGKSIVRRIFSIIATKDPFFPAYSASENTHCYCPLGSSFFTKISNFLISGFVQTQSDELETYTIRMCRDALGNLIDRVRKQFIVHHPETNAEQLAIELKSLLTSHGNVPNNMEFLSEHDENEQPSTSSAGY
ncbi:unnamed protein product [Caenorhabditis nigoni]